MLEAILKKYNTIILRMIFSEIYANMCKIWSIED